MDCREFFNNNLSSHEKCKLLQDNPYQALGWERSCSASEYSPGPVQDGETLYRQIFHPIHVDDETGKPKPALFDDASSKGLSVNRSELICRQALIEKGLAKASLDRERKPDRQFFGLASATCESMRLISTAAGGRAFCVYDTALADDPSHADVCQIVRGKQEGRSVRSKLYDAFRTVERFTEESLADPLVKQVFS